MIKSDALSYFGENSFVEGVNHRVPKRKGKYGSQDGE